MVNQLHFFIHNVCSFLFFFVTDSKTLKWTLTDSLTSKLKTHSQVTIVLSTVQYCNAVKWLCRTLHLPKQNTVCQEGDKIVLAYVKLVSNSFTLYHIVLAYPYWVVGYRMKKSVTEKLLSKSYLLKLKYSIKIHKSHQPRVKQKKSRSTPLVINTVGTVISL